MGFTQPTCCARTHPGADKLLVEDDPCHEVDEADAGGEEGGDLGGAQDLEGEHVEVGGQRPQQREEEAPHEEGPCKKWNVGDETERRPHADG